jgi:hypothetical protein
MEARATITFKKESRFRDKVIDEKLTETNYAQFSVLFLEVNLRINVICTIYNSL